MNEYPKQMRSLRDDVVTVHTPPDGRGWVCITHSNGENDTVWASNLTPIPSPDDEVEVVVKMTRKQRDILATRFMSIVTYADERMLFAACRAHRDAEA